MVASQHDHIRAEPLGKPRLYRGNDVESVNARHMQIEQDQLRGRGLRALDDGRRIIHGNHAPVPVGLEQTNEQSPNGGVVVDHHDNGVAHIGVAGRLSHSASAESSRELASSCTARTRSSEEYGFGRNDTPAAILPRQDISSRG
jgi:hypothetical protein